jgi:hypothetical protein
MANPKCLSTCPQIKRIKKNKNLNFCSCNNEIRCCDCAKQGKCKWCISYDSKIKATYGRCVPSSEYNNTNCPPELQGYDRCATLENFMNMNNKLLYLFIILIILVFYILYMKFKGKK